MLFRIAKAQLKALRISLFSHPKQLFLPGNVTTSASVATLLLSTLCLTLYLTLEKFNILFPCVRPYSYPRRLDSMPTRWYTMTDRRC